MQRGGRSWRERHHLPFLCAPGYTPNPGHREEAGLLSGLQRGPSPVREGMTTEDTDKSTDSHSLPLWKAVNQSLY